MRYPKLADELILLLEQDQVEWRTYHKIQLEVDENIDFEALHKTLRNHVHERAERMLKILDEIKEPRLSLIGSNAAQAISILATHDSKHTLKYVLKKFNELYMQDRGDTYYQAIPSMTDWLCVVEQKSQQFGTIWLGLDKKKPFLPLVEDFDSVNERRAAYGIEPLRWPRSLIMSDSEQPWLLRPLSELVMRNPTAQEYRETIRDFKI